jgi:hypothetical protein
LGDHDRGREPDRTVGIGQWAAFNYFARQIDPILRPPVAVTAVGYWGSLRQ